MFANMEWQYRKKADRRMNCCFREECDKHIVLSDLENENMILPHL
jgi:hypothetical protein